MVKASGLNARVAWVSGKTLTKYVIRSALESPSCPAGCQRCNTCEAGLSGRCHIKNVYKITCNLCSENPATYLGDSKRCVRDRFNEHLRDAKIRQRIHPLETISRSSTLLVSSVPLLLKFLFRGFVRIWQI